MTRLLARLVHYYSTYCLHGDHRACRLTCKVCSRRCRCWCHRWLARRWVARP